MRTFRILLVLGHFGPLPHLYRARLLRSEQEWRPPIPWPDLARFTPSNEPETKPGGLVWRNPRPALSQEGKRSCGGPGCVVPAKAGTTKVVQEWPGAEKLLILFRLVPFRSIPYRLRGQGYEVPAFAGTTGRLCVNDVCEQCSKRRSFDAMGSCRRNCPALMRRMSCV